MDKMDSINGPDAQPTDTMPAADLSRRDFVKKTAVSAAILGMPTIIPRGVLASPGRPGANDRIIYGHIGVGGMGQSHVVADSAAFICDVNRTRAQGIAAKCSSKPKVTQDYREVLDSKDVDAVTIGTPDHWHAIMTVHACQAGKDVYSEKPVCKTMQEAHAMLHASKEYKRVVQFGAQGRSNRNAWYAAQYIRNGQIGKVNHVNIWHPVNMRSDMNGGWGQEMAPPADLDWNMWLGPARWRPYNPAYVDFHFRWMMDFGAGFIRDRGNHAMSIVSWCMNMDQTGPVSVEATGTPSVDSVYDAPPQLNVKWEFKNPDWTLTWGQPGEPEAFPGLDDKIEWGAKYYGDRDTLIVEGGDGGCNTENKAKKYMPGSDGVHLFIDPAEADPTERHRQNWRKCIKTREETVMNPTVGRHVIVLPIIANISYVLGRKLNWDPVNFRFVGDEEANRYLAQPYRAPFHL